MIFDDVILQSKLLIISSVNTEINRLEQVKRVCYLFSKSNQAGAKWVTNFRCIEGSTIIRTRSNDLTMFESVSLAFGAGVSTHFRH